METPMRKRLVGAVKAARQAIARGFDSVLTELLALAGAGCVVYGVSLIHFPSAFLVAGLFLLAAAWGRAGTGGEG